MKQHTKSELDMRSLVFRWGRLTFTVVLTLIGAICLLKYMGWAWVVSGLYGLPSQANTVAVARHRSLMYLWIGLLTEIVLIVHLAVVLKLDAIELSGAPKLVVRGLTALTIAGGGTLGMAFLLNCVGRLLR